MKNTRLKTITTILVGALLAGSLVACAPDPLFQTFFDEGTANGNGGSGGGSGGGGGGGGGGYIIDDDTAETRYTFTLNETLSVGSYNTGNYGETNVSTEEFIGEESAREKSYSFEYYRAVRNNSGVVSLLPLSYDFNGLSPLGGSIYNTTPISNIKEVSITYDTEGENGTKPSFTYGEQNYYNYKEDINFSLTETTVTFNKFKSKFNYFLIDSGSVQLNIKSITVTHVDKATPSGSTFVNDLVHSGLKRGVPTRCTTTPVAGETSFQAYVSKETKKTYTYYDMSYIEANLSLADSVALTDPIDVANYYTIYGVAPVNYVSESDITYARSIFGDKARQISYYNRTNGYATAIPNVNASAGYAELDIALDDSYVSNRGVGRIVAWTYGINNDTYGNGEQIVCHFTDDHYATFQECDNLGGFLPRFNAERKIAGKVWSAPAND